MPDRPVIRIRDLRYPVEPPDGRYWLTCRGETVLGGAGLTAIVGANGAGKSTLLEILAGDLGPYSGSVEVLGVRLEGLRSERERHALTSRIGVLPQASRLIGYLTASQNLEQVLVDNGVRGRLVRRRRIDEALERVGLQAIGGPPASAMSGGEQKRLQVARVLVRDVQLILADEPTNSLDPDGCALLLEMLERASRRISVVVVTHDQQVVARCRQVLRLDQTGLRRLSAEEARSWAVPPSPAPPRPQAPSAGGAGERRPAGLRQLAVAAVALLVGAMGLTGAAEAARPPEPVGPPSAIAPMSPLPSSLPSSVQSPPVGPAAPQVATTPASSPGAAAPPVVTPIARPTPAESPSQGGPATPTPTPPPPIIATVAVPAVGGWVSTGIVLATGQAVTVAASGSWTPGPPETGTVGPDGSQQAWPDNFFDLQELGVCNYCAKTPTGHWAALIGYVGSDPPPPGSYTSAAVLARAQQVFLIGTSFHGSASRAGTLWLAINDDAYSGYGVDNAGQLTATVAAPVAP